ncbi:C4-dicarboxylate TRAP transporter substrate-binding protein [Oricola sp.]|uniref:C4-dicarboxylate TRAP transporter substrate-binding protein n=1 Tax=Oricola sp. TaxID=1979950 RepID=UPI0025DD0E1A|nr:C4-dicarboxylate TRAP transporter substrate-binding protein [Oricola sp.]MCI5077123.1 C4-dicarboxylate TRAP transporter substrate-binding protein [Oricola sp.]
MKHFQTTLSVLAISAAVFGTPALAQEKLRMTVATGHPAVFLWVKHFNQTFIPTLEAELAKTGEVEIEWTEAYGGTLVKLGGEAQAMQDGLIDVGQAMGVFDPANMGILNMTYSMPFGPVDPVLVTAAAEHALMETDGFLDQLADTTGVVYIGGGIAIDGYNIASTKALSTREDMAGVKISGAGPNLSWLDGTNAVGVQGSYVSFYNDIKTGVSDGLIGWITANAPSKIWEVAPYYNKVNFGAMYIGGIGVSQSRWDTLSDSTKDAFKVAAKAYQDAYFAEQAANIEAGTRGMLDGGGEVVEFDDAERNAWISEMANPVTAWSEAARARGEPVDELLAAYVAYLKDAGFTFPRDYLAE